MFSALKFLLLSLQFVFLAFLAIEGHRYALPDGNFDVKEYPFFELVPLGINTPVLCTKKLTKITLHFMFLFLSLLLQPWFQKEYIFLLT